MPQTSPANLSHMLGPSNDLSAHFCPVDAVVKVLIDQAADRDVVTSHQIKAVTDFGAWLWVVLGSNNSFDSLIQHDVGELVTGEQGAD